jgi:hypothetical protein
MGTRRRYSKEYKADAVWLAECEGVKEAAESLGIDRSMLYQWQTCENVCRCYYSKDGGRKTELGWKLCPYET